ncbi:MAG: translation initiation factor [Bacteriovoracaceae bacterium]|nr:translation initiation factor [Bacteriovoracaceae bacterium]
MSDYRLVYSSEGPIKKEEKNYAEIDPTKVKVKIRLEKQGRGGKTVTVLFELPENPTYFKDLAKELKSHCGTGGSFKDGRIELQGDHKQKCQAFLEKKGFKIKIAGG